MRTEETLKIDLMSTVTSVSCQSFACQSRLLGMVTEHEKFSKDFPGGPLAETQHSQCRGPGFSPSSGKQILHAAAKDPVCYNSDLAQPDKQINKKAFLKVSLGVYRNCILDICC